MAGKTISQSKPFYIVCAQCGDRFQPSNPRRVYCSGPCLTKSVRARAHVKWGSEHPKRTFLCGHCEREVVTSQPMAKFCSDRCRRKEVSAERRGDLISLATSTTGAISELAVSADLLAKGYHVFRALSPSCVCDLIILIRSAAYRVEVTTAVRGKNGRLQAPNKSDYSRHDIVAYHIRRTKEIIYEPALETLNN